MTTSVNKNTETVSFCLRGKVGGVDRSLALNAGSNYLGSLGSNQLVLEAAGVSRRHANLQVGEEGFLIEDLGSKNGTFVNNRKIEKEQIEPGDELRFGPVVLQFEKVHRDDAELAIAIDERQGASSSSTGALHETPLIGTGLGSAVSRQWLMVAAAFVERLPRSADADIGPALRVLIDELDVRGACVLEMTENREPVVLAASGQLEEAASETLREAFLSHLASGPKRDFYHEVLNETEGSPLSYAVLSRPGTDLLLLALAGSFAGRTESEPFFRLLLFILDGFRPAASKNLEKTTDSGYPALNLPSGYVRATSEAMSRIYDLMQNLAQGDIPILIIGETGVGKEYLAQILHRSSHRRRGPFVAINCAAIPAELLEAELFGIGDGVATGVSARKGRFQVADGGTLFLDEIGDMSPELQAKVLRALQEKEVHPVGKNPVKVDVRVLAATNQELSVRVGEGTFRADLYYRLAGYVLEIPPLRERPEDISSLVEHFLRSCARDLGKSIRGLSVRALNMLVSFPWPGNIRQLENEVRRLVYLCPENHVIDSSMLSPTIRRYAEEHGVRTDTPLRPPGAESKKDAGSEPPTFLGLDSLDIEELESKAIQEALRRCQNNQVQASKLLGISRQSLRRRMERFGYLESAST